MLFIFSLILIAVILICSLDIIFASPAMGVSPWFFVVAVLVSVVYEFAIDGFFAFIVNKCPDKWVENRKFFNVSKREQKFYEKLGIRSWKDKVWELGGLGGFSKSKISDPSNPEYIKKFLVESYKGEIDHIVGMIAGFSVIFIFPLKFALIVGLPVAIVNMFINYLSVMILRYNTPKLLILHKRAVRNLEFQKKAEAEKTEETQVETDSNENKQNETEESKETKEDTEK